VLRPSRAGRWISLALVLAALALPRLAGAQSLRFRIQPEASEISFRATSRLMNADGHFSRFNGEVMVDPAALTSGRITLSIDAASLDTGIEMRDNHLRSSDFFDVERFPTVAFQRIEAAGSRATVVGRLTLHGVTREIAVPIDVQITSTALVASGEFIVNRGEYAIRYNSFVNPIGNEVRVAFTFRARVP
jgi:polyisoprenoid-binding protein YceI